MIEESIQKGINKPNQTYIILAHARKIMEKCSNTFFYTLKKLTPSFPRCFSCVYKNWFVNVCLSINLVYFGCSGQNDLYQHTGKNVWFLRIEMGKGINIVLQFHSVYCGISMNLPFVWCGAPGPEVTCSLFTVHTAVSTKKKSSFQLHVLNSTEHNSCSTHITFNKK